LAPIKNQPISAIIFESEGKDTKEDGLCFKSL